jgi:predicted nicotinamide N-methyase
MAESTPNLPSSPAARAFFAALDGNDDKGNTSNKKQSDFVRKRIQTLGWRNRYSQDEYYPIEMGASNFSVLQVQRGELEGTYGTGATVWPAAVVMLKYLERHSESLLKGKKVIDLGAGTGVTSIGAAVLGARHVICTDGEASVIQLARDNIERASQQLGGQPTDSESNEPSSSVSSLTIADCKVDVQAYWWGAGTIQNDDACDVILIADCVLPKLYPIAPLVEALDQLLVRPNAVAIFSYEHRYYPEYDPRTKFKEMAAAKDLVVEVIPMEQQDPVYSVEDIEIWHVRRREVR